MKFGMRKQGIATVREKCIARPLGYLTTM